MGRPRAGLKEDGEIKAFQPTIESFAGLHRPARAI
jgi:hypothetical protein